MVLRDPGDVTQQELRMGDERSSGRWWTLCVFLDVPELQKRPSLL